MIVFGPVPSRRLGQSLGINNIPAKSCSYSCIYCQVGRTRAPSLTRRAFHDPEAIVAEASARIAKLRAHGEPIDHITFVPDGEPTLDIHLGREIDMLKPSGIPIAVITNGSLLWRDDVRAALAKADWVSVKVDAVREATWKRINRPCAEADLEVVLDGVRMFAGGFGGTLVTETMLVKGVNDGEADLVPTADFVAALRPATAYLGMPTRPPAEPWCEMPGEDAVARAYDIFGRRIPRVECLTAEEGTQFGFSGDIEQDLLGIAAVHPITEEGARRLVAKAGAGWDVVERLVARGDLKPVGYRGKTFYVRRLERAEGRS